MHYVILLFGVYQVCLKVWQKITQKRNNMKAIKFIFFDLQNSISMPLLLATIILSIISPDVTPIALT